MAQSTATPFDNIFCAVFVTVLGLLVGRWILRNQTGYRDFRAGTSLRVMVGFSIFSFAFAFPKGVISDHIWSLLTGLGLGAIIGMVGLRSTRFDSINAGKYDPNLLLAFAVTIPVVVYFVFFTLRSYLPSTVIEWAGGKRTALLLLGIMFGYFISYHAALWIKFRNIAKTE